MSLELLKLPVNMGKACTLTLGIAVLAVGLHSHFGSSWIKNISEEHENLKGYQLCKIKALNTSSENPEIKCPDIAMERYFVSIITICFVLSLFGFISGFFVDLRTGGLRLVDFWFHGISLVLLLIAAIVYLISATEIDSSNFDESQPKVKALVKELNFLRSEKITAALLTIIEAYIYGMIAVLILVTKTNTHGYQL